MTRRYASLPVHDVAFDASVEREGVDVFVRVTVEYVESGRWFEAVEVYARDEHTGIDVALTPSEVSEFAERAKEATNG